MRINFKIVPEGTYSTPQEFAVATADDLPTWNAIGSAQARRLAQALHAAADAVETTANAQAVVDALLGVPVGPDAAE